MRRRRKIPTEIQNEVRRLANDLCEYCHASEKLQYVRFTVDHVIPLGKGGMDTLDNLALACFDCNRRKSDKFTALDPVTGEEVLLFNPRLDSWNTHFIWSADGLFIVGLTPMGRATIEVLQFNRERVLNIRAPDVAVERHPPDSDPIQK
ncbi:HNH endonuclease [Candidatus Poribacteria bacterium]|nr:HNH endonuclease [Candidatus Poribacteria bacterium]